MPDKKRVDFCMSGSDCLKKEGKNLCKEFKKRGQLNQASLFKGRCK